MGRGFVLREPSAAACDDQPPRFWLPRKWSTLPCIECRMVRHLSSKNRARKAHSEVPRGQHEEYSISGQTGSPDHQNIQTLASFNRADDPSTSSRARHVGLPVDHSANRDKGFARTGTARACTFAIPSRTLRAAVAMTMRRSDRHTHLVDSRTGRDTQFPLDTEQP